MDFFTIPAPSFNARILVQNKLLGICAILGGFVNRDLGSIFQVFCTFSGNLTLFEKNQRVVLRETTRCSFYFEGLFSDFLRRNFYFVGENRKKVRQNREKFENLCKICWANDFELT